MIAEDRLERQALLTIERDATRKPNVDTLIDKFAITED